MQFLRQPSQEGLYGWVSTGRRAEISKESLTLRRNIISTYSLTHLSIYPSPVLPGTVGMALPLSPMQQQNAAPDSAPSLEQGQG